GKLVDSFDKTADASGKLVDSFDKTACSYGKLVDSFDKTADSFYLAADPFGKLADLAGKTACSFDKTAYLRERIARNILRSSRGDRWKYFLYWVAKYFPFGKCNIRAMRSTDNFGFLRSSSL